MKMLYVFDLDGTLADISHRVQFAQAKQWDEFHSLCGADQPYERVCELFRSLGNLDSSTTDKIIILTGRTEKYRLMTERWLERFHLFPDKLIMRGDLDFRPDTEIKLEELAKLHSHRGAAEFIILEDRTKVIQALRDAGYTVFQVREGDY